MMHIKSTHVVWYGMGQIWFILTNQISDMVIWAPRATLDLGTDLYFISLEFSVCGFRYTVLSMLMYSINTIAILYYTFLGLVCWVNIEI